MGWHAGAFKLKARRTEEYLSAFVQEQLPDGRQRVVRNGHLPERKILTGSGRWRCGCPSPARPRPVPQPLGFRQSRSARRWCRLTRGRRYPWPPSTTDQDFTIQRGCLYEAGCEKLFAEKISGARKMRPQLERLLTELRTDDVVVVTRLEQCRLARSTSELLCIAETIEEKKALDFNPLRSRAGPIRHRSNRSLVAWRPDL